MDRRAVLGTLTCLGALPAMAIARSPDGSSPPETTRDSAHSVFGLSLEDFDEVLAGSDAVAIGFGCAQGNDAAALAARGAIDHPLLGERRLRTARGIVVLVETSSPRIGLGDAIKSWHEIRNAIPEFFDGPVYFDFIFGPQTKVKEFRVMILASGWAPEAV